MHKISKIYLIKLFLFLVSNAITEALNFLSEHPEVQKKLCNEIESEFDNDEINYEKLTQSPYLDAVVRETLRLKNSLLFLGRTATVVSFKSYFRKKRFLKFTFLGHKIG